MATSSSTRPGRRMRGAVSQAAGIRNPTQQETRAPQQLLFRREMLGRRYRAVRSGLRLPPDKLSLSSSVFDATMILTARIPRLHRWSRGTPDSSIAIGRTIGARPI
jgi:hypothetical protein